MLTENQLVDIAFERLAKKFPKRFKLKTQKQLLGFVKALASGDGYCDLVIQQVQNNLFASTAGGKYLDIAAARRNVARSLGAGIGDTDFQKLVSIVGAGRKKITSKFLRLLDAIYGPYLTATNLTALHSEPYSLANGNELVVKVDAQTAYRIEFNTADAVSLSAATATEIALVISQKTNGHLMGSVKRDFKTGLDHVNIRTKTLGGQGFIQILGGDAQNALGMGTVRTIVAGLAQWTVAQLGYADQMQFTLSGGTDPQLYNANIQPGDLLTIRNDSGFHTRNCGTFVVVSVTASNLATSFVISNPQGKAETVTQLHNNDLIFYSAQTANLYQSGRIATVLCTDPGEFTLVMPVGVPIVRRNSGNALYLKGISANVTAADATTVTLNNVTGFASAGVIKPRYSRQHASGIVQSYASTSITLIDGSQFPSQGAVYSAATATFYYYSGKSGQTLTGVTPTPTAAMNGFKIKYAERYKYTSVVGQVLHGVFPNPSALVGFDVIAAGSTIVSGQLGSYLYDTKAPWTGTTTSVTLAQTIQEGQFLSKLQVGDNTALPNSGYLVFQPGCSEEEGPYRYIAKLGTNQIILDAKNTFQKTHPSGSNARLVTLGGFTPKTDNSNHAIYLTASAPARAQLEQYAEALTASGVIVNFLVVTPTYKRTLPNQIFGNSTTSTSI